VSARVRMTRAFFDSALADLERPHPFALERVAFAYCQWARADGALLLFPVEYQPVPDSEYEDRAYGAATIGVGPLRRAMKHSHSRQLGCLHVHLHHHTGNTGFSPVDLETLKNLAPPLRGNVPIAPHGGLVLSMDSGTALIWPPAVASSSKADVSIVGFPFHSSRSWSHGRKK
jgi:hypothetical protein